MVYWCYGIIIDEDEGRVYLAEVHWQKKGRGKQILSAQPVLPSRVKNDSETLLDDLKSVIEAGLFFKWKKEKDGYTVVKYPLKKKGGGK